MCKSSNFTNLTHLHLPSNLLSSNSCFNLAVCGKFPLLTHLDIKINTVGSKGIETLIVGSLQKLTFLDMNHSEVDDMGFKYLAECETLPQLYELKIFEGNPASTESKNMLRRSKKLANLRYIS